MQCGLYLAWGDVGWCGLDVMDVLDRIVTLGT